MRFGGNTHSIFTVFDEKISTTFISVKYKVRLLIEENSRPGSVLKHDYSNISEAHYLPGCQQILQPSLQVFAQMNTTWMSVLKNIAQIFLFSLVLYYWPEIVNNENQASVF